MDAKATVTIGPLSRAGPPVAAADHDLAQAPGTPGGRSGPGCTLALRRASSHVTSDCLGVPGPVGEICP